MTGTSYKVILQADQAFRIELVRAGTLPYAARGFLTSAQAQDWIAMDRRMARAPSQWLRFASRYVGSIPASRSDPSPRLKSGYSSPRRNASRCDGCHVRAVAMHRTASRID